MTIPAVLAYADLPAARYDVGGRSLLLRHLHEMNRLGITTCYVIGLDALPADVQGHPPIRHMRVEVMPHTHMDLLQQLRALPDVAQGCLFVRADCLIDPRLLALLIKASTPQWLPASEQTADELPAAARLMPEALCLWATAGLGTWLHAYAPLDLHRLDTYSATHRGPKPFYRQVIATRTDAAQATRTLIKASQKSALDLPALLLHPWFENHLVFWLCRSPITPNQVTLGTALLGFVVAALFFHGWLLTGIVLAQVCAILDGVDGKLARTSLRTSRLGQREHVVDFFVEQSWYAALTLFLVRRAMRPSLWWLGGGLMVCDMLDKICYGLGQRWFGKQLDELGAFERAFRFIAGRRNIYIWLFFVGFSIGMPFRALAVVSCWALMTTVVHHERLIAHLIHSKRDRAVPVAAHRVMSWPE